VSWVRKNKGFTLIEVLISLIIISISLGVFIQVGQSNTSNTFLLRNIMLGQNLAWNQLIIQRDIQDKTYRFTKVISDTSVERIKKVQIKTQYQQKNLSTLIHFIYVAK
jgi:prepilin-type N-terminal cleavage/methylation domain-containing protein